MKVKFIGQGNNRAPYKVSNSSLTSDLRVTCLT